MIKTTEAPILITGVFRSGTTLISQILNNHPNLSIVYDSVNFMRFCYDRYNPINNIENATKLVDDLFERINTRWNFSFDTRSVINQIKDTTISYSLIYNTVMYELLLKGDNSKKYWGEKTTLVWSKIPSFFEMFPNGRVVHIIRDPRAILASWKTFTHAPGYDYLDSTFNCIDSMQKMNMYTEKFETKRYCSVRFEDLVQEPKKVVKDMCNKLGLDYNNDMIDPNKFRSKMGGAWKGNSMFHDGIKEISSSTINLWENKLQSWEIAFVQKVMPGLLEDFGYDFVETGKVDINDVINKIQTSELVTEGALNYLFTGEGFERFPTNPLNPNNWGTE